MRNGLIIDKYGSKRWYKNGLFHQDGTKYWYLNDKLHREDGPAIEYIDGTKYWFLNGNRHREGGPAVEFADGYKVWYYSDKYLGSSGDGMTNEKFLKIIKLKLFW